MSKSLNEVQLELDNLSKKFDKDLIEIRAQRAKSHEMAQAYLNGDVEHAKQLITESRVQKIDSNKDTGHSELFAFEIIGIVIALSAVAMVMLVRKIKK